MTDELQTDEIKSGARNNADDRARIRQLRAHGREIDRITRELEPEDEDPAPEGKALTGDDLASYGDAVKALGDGKVGGYLVRYGDPATLDLEGDFFDCDTDYGVDDGNKIPVYYQHGMDGKLKNRRIGRGIVKYDDVGLWLEAQLEMRDEYEKRIYELVERGKLGWSSGAAGHLVEREPIGKAQRIKVWAIAEASLTPTPAEPRNGVTPIKSLITNQQTGETGEDNPVTVAVKTIEPKPIESQTQVNKMDENEVKTLIDSAVDAAVKGMIEKMPVTNGGGVQVIKDEADQPFKSAGEFFQAVKNAALYPQQEDPRLRPLKASGLNEGVPSQGGYLLQSELASGIMERAYKTGEILSRVASDSVGANSNGMVYNAIDETSRVDGSRYGGIVGYWLAEAGTKTASKPAFRQLELKLKKVIAAAYATDELLQDAVALESWLTRTVPNELRFKVEDAIYNGDGVGKPLGIMNSPALITVQRDTASSIKAADVLAMWSRRWAGVNDYVWLINQDAFPQLPQMSIANQPVFVPPGGLSSSPYGSLLGKPVIEVEYAASLNTSGDIMLASLSQYQTINKGGVQSASSIHVQFMTDETTFRFVYRVDGAPSWASTLTPFKGSNTQSPFVVLGSASA